MKQLAVTNIVHWYSHVLNRERGSSCVEEREDGHVLRRERMVMC